MFELKPGFEFGDSTYNASRFFFHGKCFLENVDGNENVFKTLPVGHSAYFPVEFSLDNSTENYPKEAASWLAKPLIDSVRNRLSIDATINILKKTSKKSVVIVNCLDDCYAHIVYKLFNAQKYANQKELAIFVLIHKSVEPFVPEYVDEIWSIDAPISELSKEIKGLDDKLKEAFDRFDGVFLSYAYPRLDLRNIRLKDFLKIERFDLSRFESDTPQITFVFRNDRLWLSSAFDDFLFRSSKKFGIGVFRKYFVQKQILQMAKTAKLIKMQIPNAGFAMTGFSEEGHVPSIIDDQRKEQPSHNTVLAWNDLYANSQLVIGVHGSAMMMPTALAAGFINLMPRTMLDHIAEDTLPSDRGRLSLFLCRFLDIFSSPKLLSQHVITMFESFHLHNRNNEEALKPKT